MTDEKELALYRKIFKHANPEKFAGVYFICGEGGNKDENGLPERIIVCPADGLTVTQTYDRVDRKEELSYIP